MIELLESTLARARSAVGRGLDLEATRKAVDLSDLRRRFVEPEEKRGRSFDAFFITPAVERAWLEARGELDRAKPYPAWVIPQTTRRDGSTPPRRAGRDSGRAGR